MSLFSTDFSRCATRDPSLRYTVNDEFRHKKGPWDSWSRIKAGVLGGGRKFYDALRHRLIHGKYFGHHQKNITWNSRTTNCVLGQ